MALLGLANDIRDPENFGGAYNIVNFVVYFFVVRAVIRNEGLGRENAGGFGTYFGVSILSGLGIVLGYLLLIVPGIVLSVRWFLAYVIAVVEDRGVTGSLSESWEVTEGNSWPIFLTGLLMFLPFIAILILVEVIFEFNLSYEVQDAIYYAGLAIMNAAFSATGVATLVMGVAVYRMLARAGEDVAGVFA